VAKVELDYEGIGRAMKAMRGPITRLAAEVAAAVDVPKGVPVLVRPYTTDRAAARVTIAHLSGAALQAKHGALTKAAASLGLEVTSRE
jgi:hypothetical protein